MYLCYLSCKGFNFFLLDIFFFLGFFLAVDELLLTTHVLLIGIRGWKFEVILPELEIFVLKSTR